MTTADDIRDTLGAHATPARALASARYFKTGPGQYGEGDVFIGVTVPKVRGVAHRFRDASLQVLDVLLASQVHEERLCALVILADQFRRADRRGQQIIYRFYLTHADRINNWDLVDISAPRILGAYLLSTGGSGSVLVKLAHSRNLWKRRIAILGTAAFIGAGRHIPTFNIARLLLDDTEDLIHKAVGWMLREVGKRIGQDVEEEFLKRHYRRMPRTMLRYAIERFPKRLQQAYLTGRI